MLNAVLRGLLALAFAAAAHAQSDTARQQAMEAAIKAADAVTVAGPSEVKLAAQAVLKLPAGMLYIPQPAAGQLMQAMGNSVDSSLLGLVRGAGDAHWLVVARWEAAGYIKDDDAKDWNVDDLFKSLKEGTEEANKRRKEMGFPALEIVGWVQKPSYDSAAHRLVWSMAARSEGRDADDQSVNYNTYALGREGYVTLNLITARASVEQDKPAAHALLGALQFNDGKRYDDFNSKTDKVAEYGLAALVAGVAAKKLGLIAVILAFFAKFAKVLVLVGAGAIAVVAKLFKRRDTA
ncbi:MAG TPA: DUF2167 domain-containing protein [Albitalea sp.]